MRKLAQGDRSQEMRYWRFLANRRVTVKRLIEGWSDQTHQAVAGRHVLAIQDTSELKFATTEDDRRGLGKVKKGNSYGVLLHAMLAVDADGGSLLAWPTRNRRVGRQLSTPPGRSSPRPPPSLSSTTAKASSSPTGAARRAARFIC
jgi:hypothetical protein